MQNQETAVEAAVHRAHRKLAEPTSAKKGDSKPPRKLPNPMTDSSELSTATGGHEEAASSPLITTTFVVVGEDLDPTDATRRIGIAPSDVCADPKITGRFVPSRQPFVRRPYWSLGFQNEPSYSTDDELKRLLDLLWPKRTQITEYLQETGYEATFTSSVTINEDRPVYELSADTLRRLSHFNVEWVLDIIY